MVLSVRGLGGSSCEVTWEVLGVKWPGRFSVKIGLGGSESEGVWVVLNLR